MMGAFINVEGELTTELATATGKPAATGPTEGVSQFLVVRRTGGPARLRTSDMPLFVVEAYAKFEDDAIELLNAARAHLQAMRKLGPRRIMDRAEVGGPGNLPDPKLPTMSRYTVTWEMHLR
jgi:hypothetical protein